ncbi:biotin-dependent carboxyltransferase family protein [Marinimicrobium sp. ARAG 43.8]|uniref:5-oxoprolinase subunit C family protein n=1 Tax=Marinimicrobium sp. ARAG 43.8 TaxID=3418719 RepID=UPI003CF74DA5
MTGLRVVKPGALTLIQDLGRFGYQHLGVSPGGAMDEHAYLWANRLLGNRSDSPALEISLGGLQLEVHTDIVIAITGADLQARCNGEPLACWQTHTVRRGDALTFGFPVRGVRSYLAVAGGFLVEPVFGSVSTVVREGIGGLDGMGQPLRAGDWLPVAEESASNSLEGYLQGHCHRRVPPRFIPDYGQAVMLRVLEGQQCSEFARAEVQRFYEHPYTVSRRGDRMGVTLDGLALRGPAQGMTSEGIPFGAIQVPPDGQPIVLLKDRQTMGGYPKIGTVHPLDAFSLAQCPPGTAVQFTPVDAQAYFQAWRVFSRFFNVNG